jgi:hypothetical protein
MQSRNADDRSGIRAPEFKVEIEAVAARVA